MARSIYQGSAAAVCQARELGARRRARGLEKKATGSFLPSFSLSFNPLSPSLYLAFSLPCFLSLFVLRSHPQPFSRLVFLLLSLFFLLSSPFIPCYFPLFRCFWVIFHRCSGRQKRRDGGGGVASDTYTKTRESARARAHETARG